jgi:hypothetical protein
MTACAAGRVSQRRRDLIANHPPKFPPTLRTRPRGPLAAGRLAS